MAADRGRLSLATLQSRPVTATIVSTRIAEIAHPHSEQCHPVKMVVFNPHHTFIRRHNRAWIVSRVKLTSEARNGRGYQNSPGKLPNVLRRTQFRTKMKEAQN